MLLLLRRMAMRSWKAPTARARARGPWPGQVPRPESLPCCGRLPAAYQVSQQAHPRPAAAQGGGAPLLVDVDGGDKHGAHHDLLPERLDADDHESVLQR